MSHCLSIEQMHLCLYVTLQLTEAEWIKMKKLDINRSRSIFEFLRFTKSEKGSNNIFGRECQSHGHLIFMLHNSSLRDLSHGRFLHNHVTGVTRNDKKCLCKDLNSERLDGKGH